MKFSFQQWPILCPTGSQSAQMMMPELVFGMPTAQQKNQFEKHFMVLQSLYPYPCEWWVALLEIRNILLHHIRTYGFEEASSVRSRSVRDNKLLFPELCL
jgi:hypothetical protein